NAPTAADPLDDLGQDVVNASLEQRLGRNQMQAQGLRTAAILGPVQGSADAELHRPRGVDQSFLDRSATPGAVGVALSPVVVPGVCVRVEIDQAERAMPLQESP